MSKLLSKFLTKRADGRSDAQVVIDLVGDATPGTVFDYQKIAEELGKDSTRDYDTPSVQSAVGRAERRLAVEKSRALLNVRGVGYKLAAAAEHQKIAGLKRERSEKLLRRGVMTLQHVRWDEMSDNERRAHEGHLLVTQGLYAAMQGLEQRIGRVESAIRGVLPEEKE